MDNAPDNYVIVGTIAIVSLVSSVALTLVARRHRMATTVALICWGLFVIAAAAAVVTARPELALEFRHARLVVGL